MSKRGWLLFIAVGVIWGMPYMFIRIAVATIDPLVIAFGRTLIGAMLLLPMALHRKALGPAFRHWQWLLVFTIVEISGPWLLIGHAETRLNSSTTGLLIAMVPLFAAILVAWLGHEHLERRRIAGLALGFLGVATIVGLDIHFSDMGAAAALIVSALGYAIGPIIINRKLADAPPIGVVTGSLILATLIYSPFVPMLWPAQPGFAAIVSVCVLGLICTATAFMFFFALIAEIGPARATVIAYINPVVAVILGIAFLDEPFTVAMAVGSVMVIAGSILAAHRGVASQA
jgi:drug/metabolite transporter (DMT)-like permease